MSSSPIARPNGSGASTASFPARARHVTGQAALYDLVQDMADALHSMDSKLDRLIQHLGVPNSTEIVAP